jgi:hypothetical protein
MGITMGIIFTRNECRKHREWRGSWKNPPSFHLLAYATSSEWQCACTPCPGCKSAVSRLQPLRYRARMAMAISPRETIFSRRRPQRNLLGCNQPSQCHVCRSI